MHIFYELCTKTICKNPLPFLNLFRLHGEVNIKLSGFKSRVFLAVAFTIACRELWEDKIGWIFIFLCWKQTWQGAESRHMMMVMIILYELYRIVQECYHFLLPHDLGISLIHVLWNMNVNVKVWNIPEWFIHSSYWFLIFINLIFV